MVTRETHVRSVVMSNMSKKLTGIKNETPRSVIREDVWGIAFSNLWYASRNLSSSQKDKWHQIN